MIAMLLAAATVAAQEAPVNEGLKRGKPVVPSERWAAYDIGSLTEGEWAEYEISVGTARIIWRISCVLVEADYVDLESYVRLTKGDKKLDPNNELKDDGSISSYTIGIADRIVKKARVMTADDRVFEAVVQPGRDRILEGEAGVEATVTMEDNQRAKDKVLPCEKIELAAKYARADAVAEDLRARVLLWVSEKAPFRLHTVEKSDWFFGRDVTWGGDRKPKPGGVVRVEMKAWPMRSFKTKDNTAKYMMKLVNWGKGAAAAVPK
jgi:hypothetical protein